MRPDSQAGTQPSPRLADVTVRQLAYRLKLMQDVESTLPPMESADDAYDMVRERIGGWPLLPQARRADR